MFSELFCAYSYKPWSQAAPLLGPLVISALHQQFAMYKELFFTFRCCDLSLEVCSSGFSFLAPQNIFQLQSWVYFPNTVNRNPCASVRSYVWSGQAKRLIFTLKPEVGATSSLHSPLTAGLVVPFRCGMKTHCRGQ